MVNDNKFVRNLGPASLSTEEAISKAIRVNVVQFSSDAQPNLDSVKTFVVQQGVYVAKVLKCWDIRSTRTREYKFSNLVFATLRKTKKRGWEFELHRSITLGDKNNPDVIERLIRFLSSVTSLDTSGQILLVDSNGLDLQKLDSTLNAISDSGQQSVLISKILNWINTDSEALGRLSQLSSDALARSQSLVAALNYGRYRRTLERFELMVEENLPEHDYQKFLDDNIWLFGSEYSRRERRKLVVGQQLDFPLRRTVDGYLDAIEIKTPLNGQSGFNWDRSHDNYYPSAEIHKHVAQLRNYLNSLERERFTILGQFGIDVTKVRGKLIVGRNGTNAEQEARKLYNADSRTIEVISFDGVIAIGKRILEIMIEEHPSIQHTEIETIVSTASADNEIPC